METAHPITILQTIYKKAALLLIPTVRGIYCLFYDRSEFAARWISGMWVDFLLLMVLIIVSVYNWKSVRYIADSRSIILKRGVLYSNEKIIKQKNVASITCYRPFIYRIFKAERLYVDTEGGGGKSTDMSFTVKSCSKSKLLRQSTFSGFAGKTYRPRAAEILFLSLCITNTLASTVYFVLLINRMGNIAGRNILNEFIFKVTRAGSYIAFAVILIQCLGIIRNFLYYGRFAVHRADDVLYFENGFFSRTKSICRVSFLNYIDYRQNFISLLFNMEMVFIQCTGYGKARKKEALLIPTGKKSSVDSRIKVLLPEFAGAPDTDTEKICRLKPSGRSFIRYIRMPVLIYLTVLISGIYLTRVIRGLEFIVFMITIPCILYAVTCGIAFFRTGIFCNDSKFRFISLCYAKGLNIHTVSFYSHKISHLKIRRSCFQRKNKTCDIILYTGGDGGHKHIIKGLDYDEALFFFFSRQNFFQLG